MADIEIKPARLQVANMRPEDGGRGLARLPRNMMNELALSEGDVVEIVGKRSTPARAVHSYPDDEGLNVVRLDGLQRANAGVGSGDQARCGARHRSPRRASFSRPRSRTCGCRGRRGR